MSRKRLGRWGLLVALCGVLGLVACEAAGGLPGTSGAASPTESLGQQANSTSPVVVTEPETHTPEPASATATSLGTPDLTLTVAAQRVDATSYAFVVTRRARNGFPPPPPYETWRAEVIAEETQEVMRRWTLTPQGPLPFPGRFISRGEIVGRASNINVIEDPAYIEREIFSLYRRAWALLSNQAGPPGADFRQRLGEIMWQGTERQEGFVNRLHSQDKLDGCTFDILASGVEGRLAQGRYLRITPDASFESEVYWQSSADNTWGDSEDFPDQTVNLRDRAYVLGIEELYTVGLQSAYDDGGLVSGLIETVEIATGEVVKSKQDNLPSGLGFRSDMIAVWVPELAEWRLSRLASPYCRGARP